MNIKSEFCPKDCKYLTLTELQQDNLFKAIHRIYPHMCSKYEAKLYHMWAHPDLYRCEACLKNTEETLNE